MVKMTVSSFEDLEIWQLAEKLAIKIYELTTKFPSSEKFGLVSLLRAAVVSIAANIAEGFGRYHLKDKINFFYNARGSLLELKSHLLIAKDVGLVNKEDSQEILEEIKNLGIKLNNFISALRKTHH